MIYIFFTHFILKEDLSNLFFLNWTVIVSCFVSFTPGEEQPVYIMDSFLSGIKEVVPCYMRLSQVGLSFLVSLLQLMVETSSFPLCEVLECFMIELSLLVYNLLWIKYIRS